MYGLVNQAIRDLVLSSFDRTIWSNICRHANVHQDHFQDLKSYPDQLTYALVAGASAELSLPSAEVLREFGKHWVKYTGRVGHHEVFDSFPPSKDGLLAFLDQLDDLHARIMMAMPDLLPPQIACTKVTESSFRVHYGSTRVGLEPMVIGLLEGLLELFLVVGRVRLITSTVSSGQTEAVFLVDFDA